MNGTPGLILRHYRNSIGPTESSISTQTYHLITTSTLLNPRASSSVNLDSHLQQQMLCQHIDRFVATTTEIGLKCISKYHLTFCLIYYWRPVGQVGNDWPVRSHHSNHLSRHGRQAEWVHFDFNECNATFSKQMGQQQAILRLLSTRTRVIRKVVSSFLMNSCERIEALQCWFMSSRPRLTKSHASKLSIRLAIRLLQVFSLYGLFLQY